jgi:UDP-glucose 4-epimerase
MKIGITGGAGFIGSNLANFLANQGHKVKVLDNLSNGKINNLEIAQIEFIDSNILDKETLEKFFADVEYLVHLAALGSVPRSINYPLEVFQVNVVGTLNLLELARKYNIPILFSSSSSVYGSNLKIPKSELDWLSPLSPYASSKMSCEAMVSAWATSYKMDASIIRLFNVFGPNQRWESEYAAVIPKWCSKIIKGEEIQIYGDGNQLRDFTYIKDVVEIISIIINEKRSFGGTLNLAFNNQVSLNCLINELASINSNVKHTYMPARAGDISNSLSDGVLIKKIFPEVRPNPFRSSLNATYKWIENNLD